jgi:DNA mismatch repair ATPase MutL
MARYEKEFWDDDPGLVGIITTGGIANVVHKALGAPINIYCKITDSKSGASAVGSGATRSEASANAWFNLTGEKDNRYKESESNRVNKQKEWEERQRERDRKQKEWEARNAERERKQKEWERKQKEWEARKAERERKQREWEERQRERERKQKEWEARKAERERKQKEWEERQRERDRKKSEWEQRKQESENRRQHYQENKRNNGSRRGGGKGNGGGCYITTATCLTLGKDDFCHELMTFRNFRDTYLKEHYPLLIEKYYMIAPQIVESIDKNKNRKIIYTIIWNKYLKDCYLLIKQNNFDEAKELYINMVTELEIIFKR